MLAPARRLSLLARGRGVTCQLRPQTSSQHRVCRAAKARRRSLSLGWRRSTRACSACARCRDRCGRVLPYQMALRQRDASLLRRKTVVRRASCGLKLQASAAWLARHRRGGARCLWGGDAALELASRARGAATGCGRFVSRRKMPHRRDGSLLRRAAVVRRASCDLQLQASAACVARRRRVGARCLWGGGAALELASRARRAALAVIGSCP